MKISSWVSLPEISFRACFRFAVLYILSLLFAAFGQPDRALVFPLLAYVFGYSVIFYALLTMPSRRLRVFTLFSWGWLLEMYQVGWMSTTDYFGFAIVIAYLIITCLLALQFGIFAYFFPGEGKLSYRHVLALSSFWVILEWSRLYYFCGFPFNTVGLVLSFSTASLQLASIFGVYGLTFWVFLASLAGAKSFSEKGGGPFVIWTVLLLAPFVFGYYHMQYHLTEATLPRKLKTAMIQTGLFAEQKWAFPGQEGSFIDPLAQWKKTLSYLDQSGEALFDYVILPEGAFHGDAYEPQYSYEAIIAGLPALVSVAPALDGFGNKKEGKDRWLVSNAWIAQAISNLYRAELIIGLLDYDPKKDRSFNSAFHFIPFGRKAERYDKRILVPMSEYLPFSFWGSFLEQYGINTFFTAGKEAKIFRGKVPVSVSICFEEGFGGLIREGKLKGAEMFVNVTNDAWFPESRLAKEHFNMGRIRSVENGVPLLRSCNTGVTAAVDCFGRIIGTLAERDMDGNPVSGILVAEINSQSYETIFSRFGNGLILLISAGFSLVFLLINVGERPKLYLLKKD